MDNIAILGGTFDPVHFGHLSIAQTIQQQFHFSSFLFLPCRTPVHKGVSASTTQRIEMLQLALKAVPIPEASLCLNEINRTTPSYMVDTLTELREKAHGPVSITLILGWDSFLTLPNWHRHEKILSLCHLLVVNRPNTSWLPSLPLQVLLKAHQTIDPNLLKITSHGSICFFDAGTYDISSSVIRKQVQSQQSISEAVPEVVGRYISEHGLYQTLGPQNR